MSLYTPCLQTMIAALIPMILGMIWFHPKVFGAAWMKGARMKPEDGEGVNMPVMMGLGYLMALIIGSFLKSYAVYHDGTPEDATFMHGAFHGLILGGMLGIPTLVSATLWERKSITYYLIQVSYWLIVFALMGGLIFAWRSGYADLAKSMG
jgi:Protein of unknown function (DUF1761)